MINENVFEKVIYCYRCIDTNNNRILLVWMKNIRFVFSGLYRNNRNIISFFNFTVICAIDIFLLIYIFMMLMYNIKESFL